MIIITLLICFTIIGLNQHPYEVKINLSSDDNTKADIIKMADLQTFQNCIDKCKYIDGRYDLPINETLYCFNTCEHN